MNDHRVHKINKEHKCRECTHRDVCDFDMTKRCQNYLFGTSKGRGCETCTCRYTRYGRNTVPCFMCRQYKTHPDVIAKQQGGMAGFGPMMKKVSEHREKLIKELQEENKVLKEERDKYKLKAEVYGKKACKARDILVHNGIFKEDERINIEEDEHEHTN